MTARSAAVPALVLAAALCAIAPIPPEWVERVYSGRWYPALQSILTPFSNLIPIALLDLAAAALLLATIVSVAARIRLLGMRRALVRTSITALGAAAAIYLLFLALWGLNYRRVPLERKLAYEPGRLTRDAVLAFASTAAAAVNDTYMPGRSVPPDGNALALAFASAQRSLGAARTAVTGVPKRSLLTLYFRHAAIDGMTDPFFLEIIVNTDVLPFERPFVVAHEWSHLAGYANEAEANFVAWLTCVRGDPMARYSGWLAAYEHAMHALPRPDRARVTGLAPGPRQDLRAMAARYARSSPVVRDAAREVYDEYLRANRVAEGIGSYDEAIRLMVGTRFDEGWTPQLR